VTTVAYLTDPRALDSEEATSDMLVAARALGRQTMIVEARDKLDIDAAFATFVERGAGALVVGPHILFDRYGKEIVELAARHNIPAIYFRHQLADGVRRIVDFTQIAHFAVATVVGDCHCMLLFGTIKSHKTQFMFTHGTPSMH
jgi:hypothetical protein